MTTITKDMSIGEVMNMGCAAHGQNVDELVEKLNRYLAEKE